MVTVRECRLYSEQLGPPMQFRRFHFTAVAIVSLAASNTATAQEPRSSYYWRPSLALNDVSTERLVTWLGKAGIQLPFAIGGNVSFSLKGGVPLTAPNDPLAYELDGYVTSSRLQIQNFILEDLAVTLRYRNGLMVLQSVRFHLPKREAEPNPPSLSGRGQIQISPAGDVNLEVDVNDFKLARISEFSGADLRLTGNASGKAILRIANADFANPSAWSGSATLSATEVRSPGLYAPRAEAGFRLAENRVTFDRLDGIVNEVPLGLTGAVSLSEDAKTASLEDVRLNIFGGAVQVRGRAPIGEPTAQDLAIEAADLDLGLLDQQLRPLLDPELSRSIPPLLGRVSFAFDGTVPFQKLGDYSLWRLRRTEIRSPRVLVGTMAAENLLVQSTFDGSRFLLQPFGWDWPAAGGGAQGRVEGSIDAQLTLLGRVEARLQSTRTPVAPIATLFGLDDSFDGFVNGSVAFAAPALALKANPSNLAAWTADVDLSGENLTAFIPPWEFRRLRMQWRSPTFDLQGLELALAGSPIQATGRVKAAADFSQLDLEQGRLTTEFGRASADGIIPLNRDRPGRLALRLEGGDAAALSRIVGPDVFNGAGALSGNIELNLAPAAATPRILSAAGRANGVVDGSFEAKIPVDAAQTAETMFTGASASVDLRSTVPLSLLGRNVTDAAVVAIWKDGVLDVSRFNAAVEGVPFGGHGKARLDQEFFALEDVDLDLLGGKVRGRLRHPRSSSGSGDAEITVDGVDLAALKPFLSSLAPRLSGRIDGSARATIPPAPTLDAPHPIVVEGDLRSPNMAIGNWRILRSTAAVKTSNGLADFSFRGETLDGLMEWNGVHALPQGRLQGDDRAALSSRGTVSLRNIHLGRLAAAAPRRQISDDLLQGRLNASLGYTQRIGALPTGTGQAEVVGLANDTGMLSQRMTSSVTFDGQRLRMPDVTGDLMDGRLRGLVVLNTRDMRNGAFYRADVVGMSLSKTFRQIGADGAWFTGVGDVQVRGRISNAVTGAGTIEIPRGTFVGLDVSSWRSPAEIEVNLMDYSGRFAIPESSAQLAQGQLRGKVDYAWDAAGRLQSDLDFTNVNLRGLLRSSARLQSMGEGRITGRLQLGGRSIRGMNDLTGGFNARLQNAQAGSWPILDQVLSLLTGVGGRSLTFERGLLSGTIGSGAARLNQLELVSQRARVVGGGAIRFNGGLDLDFTAFTGNTTVGGRGVEFAAAQLLTAANPSTAVLYRVNRLLSDRVIAVKVTGTVSSPVTRLKPGPTLTAEAARFLLDGFVPVPGSAGSTGR
jgi:hypothetical protein